MSMRIPAVILLAAAACGGKRSSAAASSSDPRLDLALAAPASSRDIRAPGLIVTRDARHAPHGASTIERELDGERWTCAYDGSTPERVSLGRASCNAMSVDDDRVVVPFALREGTIGIDRDEIHLEPASASDPTESREAIARENERLRRTDLRVVDDRSAPGGYAAIVEAGDAMFDHEFEIWVRLHLGARDVKCGSIVDTRDQAERGRDLCLALRAP